MKPSTNPRSIAPRWASSLLLLARSMVWLLARTYIRTLLKVHLVRVADVVPILLSRRGAQDPPAQGHVLAI